MLLFILCHCYYSWWTNVDVPYLYESDWQNWLTYYNIHIFTDTTLVNIECPDFYYYYFPVFQQLIRVVVVAIPILKLTSMHREKYNLANNHSDSKNQITINKSFFLGTQNHGLLFRCVRRRCLFTVQWNKILCPLVIVEWAAQRSLASQD